LHSLNGEWRIERVSGESEWTDGWVGQWRMEEVIIGATEQWRVCGKWNDCAMENGTDRAMESGG